MHYLSAVWGLSIMFHAPATNIFWVMGACVCLYLGDWSVGYSSSILDVPEVLKMTPLGESAVEIVFEHPQGFVNHGGNYVYLCLPWLGKAEWHAFSLYAHPTLENHSSVCVRGWATGRDACSTPCPCPSPSRDGCTWTFPVAVQRRLSSRKHGLLGESIGITPTLGIVKLLAGSRKVNVVWMCRQADLIEYFLRTVPFDGKSVDDHLLHGQTEAGPLRGTVHQESETSSPPGPAGSRMDISSPRCETTRRGIAPRHARQGARDAPRNLPLRRD